ncbi:unnamed protein product [Dicrocoelium dendriticum]|nr:unnamed protein product [Dicrocoelium dendriticum]
MVTTDYIIGEYLGSGKFGEVKRCEEKRSGGEFAAKFVPIASKDDLDSVQNEIAIMNKLRHPRLIQLYDAYQYKNEVVMVLELITGGELFERIIDESFDLNEARCIRFMNEILQGVEYIHTQGVLHLDLKPENILCLSRTSFKTKIIDFGLARFYDGKELCVLFGTPEFVSPEVISYEPVTPAADMWSLGVICYVMLSGLSPFMGDSQSETLSNILRVTYDFNYPEFDDISDYAKNFIRKLLVRDPRKRLTASECLQDPWIKRKKNLKRKGTVSKKSLKHFVYRRKWQKAVNAIVALLRMGVVLHHSHEVNSPSMVNAEFQPQKPIHLPECQSNTSMNKDKALQTTAKKEGKIGAIFTRKTPKRSIGSESDSPTTSQANSSRRSSILSRFGCREGSVDSTKLVNPSVRRGKSDKKEKSLINMVKENPKIIALTKRSPAFPPVSSTAPSEHKQQTPSGGSSNVSAQIPVSLHNVEEPSRCIPLPINKLPCTNDTPNLIDKPELQARTQRPNELTSSKQISVTKLSTARKPVRKTVAPSTGGIAAKIGFFSNLSK